MKIDDENKTLTDEWGIKKGDPVTYVRHGRERVSGTVKGFWGGMVCLSTTETKTGYFQSWPQHLEQNACDQAGR